MCNALLLPGYLIIIVQAMSCILSYAKSVINCVYSVGNRTLSVLLIYLVPDVGKVLWLLCCIQSAAVVFRDILYLTERR